MHLVRALALTITLWIMSPAIFADGIDPARCLEKADISIPYYGSQLFGERTFKLFDVGNGTQWFIHQSRYGGDGEHTENIMMIFEVGWGPRHIDKDGVFFPKGDLVLNKILQYNISNVTFHFKDKLLSQIRGEYIATLCDVCDGWEVSEEGDIFNIPIQINVPALSISSTLDERSKKLLLGRLNQQIRNKYGNKDNASYAEEIERRIYALIEKPNPSFKRDAKLPPK